MDTRQLADLKAFLDEKVELYNRPSFIGGDPLCIPHLFAKKQDIEISGFIAATLAWGLRKTIISKCKELFALMDWAPHDFVLNHSQRDLVKLTHFKHRTFNSTDLMYFLEWMQWYYQQHDSLEDAFARYLPPGAPHTGPALSGFAELFFSLPDAPARTRKHVASPLRGSSCKRINMYLRWMVRQDDKGVDFGIWRKISPAQLLCPVDLHVERVATALGMMHCRQVNWNCTLALTELLRQMDPADPVKYDYALFGLGIMEKYGQHRN